MPDDLTSAVHLLQEGGLIAYPTETFYGLGVLPRRRSALARLWRLKRRSQRGPLSLLLPAGRWPADLGLAPAHTTASLAELAAHFWPGPLTIVVDASPTLDARLVGPDGGVAVRVSSHPLARRLIDLLGEPLTATSANFRGEPPASNAAMIAASGLGARLDFVLDGGETSGQQPSTVLRLFERRGTILRMGAVARDELDAVLAALSIALD